MESLVWSLRTMSGAALAPFVAVLVFVLVVCWDYPLLVPYIFPGLPGPPGRAPTAGGRGRSRSPQLVVIPLACCVKR